MLAPTHPLATSRSRPSMSIVLSCFHIRTSFCFRMRAERGSSGVQLVLHLKMYCAHTSFRNCLPAFLLALSVSVAVGSTHVNARRWWYETVSRCWVAASSLVAQAVVLGPLSRPCLPPPVSPCLTGLCSLFNLLKYIHTGLVCVLTGCGAADADSEGRRFDTRRYRFC